MSTPVSSAGIDAQSSFEMVFARIQSSVERLRSLTQATVQASWHWCVANLEEEDALNPERWPQWAIAPLNDRDHIAWPKGRQVLWLGQRLPIPDALNGYPLSGLLLRLSLTWWAEDAQIFVNGARVQCGDLYDCSARIVLKPRVVPGETIDVAIRLVSPGHDDGALVKSVMVYEMPDGAATPEPGFVADELAVLAHYLRSFAPEAPEGLETLAIALDPIPWEQVGDREGFDGAIAHLRDQLLPFSDWIKHRTIKLLGHAHLDLAWLWPISETWDVAQRTFESALNLQADYPDLIFGHSTPMLYEWMEHHRPDLFTQIQAQMKTGQWEAIAGLWVEPELNVVGGESIVRQVLYGQRYCQEKFGQISRLAWLPDTFGFCWQLPQILRQGGIDYFVTQKLRWNDTTEFPHELFEWRSPDGTAITSLMSAPIGTTIDPVQMVEYACTWEQSTGQPTCLWLPGVGDHGGGPTRDMIELAHRWQQSPFFPSLEFSTAIDFLDNLTKAEGGIKAEGRLRRERSVERRQKAEGGEPLQMEDTVMRYASANASYAMPEGNEPTSSPSIAMTSQNPKSKIQNSPVSPLPNWPDELYLELHRGCYTVHADQKYWNRRCEALLYEAELWSSIATLLTGADYPKIEIEQTWKTVLFNQFHDILPGTSIPEVYEVVNPQWEGAIATSQSLLSTALTSITTHLLSQLQLQLQPPTPDSIPLLIFNPLNWQRTDIVTVSLPSALSTMTHWSVQTPDGISLSCQTANHQSANPHLLITPPPIPSLGYQLCWLTPSTPPLAPENSSSSLGFRASTQPTSQESTQSAKAADYCLENAILQITIDPTTGDIQSILDKPQHRSILSGPGNQLLAFKDDGEYWDAWNIASNYRDHPLPGTTLQSIQWIANGPVEQRIRVVRRLGNSTFSQDYVLPTHSPILRIESQVDWRDRHTVVKAAFPLTVTADHATYDMPFGAIQRPTNPQTPTEKAKWEVPGLAWADITEASTQATQEAATANEPAYGVSILSDYKHGYSATPAELQLTLLRGPTWPDPESDQGHHRFVYAIYPHTDSWQAAQTVHRSYELRHPLQVKLLPSPSVSSPSVSSPSVSPSLTPTQGTQPIDDLSPRASFIPIPGNHFVVSAIKPSEACADTWIVRGYECHGQPGPLFEPQHPDRSDAEMPSPTGLHCNLLDMGASSIEPVSLLETPIVPTLPTAIPPTQREEWTTPSPNTIDRSRHSFSLRPWGIHSWAVKGLPGK